MFRARVCAVVSALCASLCVVGVGCIEATNPFDPDTPLDDQQKARLTGTIVVQDAFDDATREALLATITVGLLDDNGRRVTDAGDQPIALDLLEVATPVPGRTVGRFVFGDRVPGTYTLVIDGAPARYQAPTLPTVRLVAGADVDVGDLVYSFVGVGDDGPGSIIGEVDAVDGAVGPHTVSLFRRRNDTVELVSSVVTDRAFSFVALGFGSYAIVVDTARATPVYRLGLVVSAVDGSGDDDGNDGALQHQLLGEQALVVHPITAALKPATDPTVVFDEGLVFVRGESAPLLVLPFVTDADSSLGITGMRLSTSPDFVDAAGDAVAFVPHLASTSVPLPAADGSVTIFAQFEARASDNAFVFVSDTVSTTVIKDTTAPTIVDVIGIGLAVDGSDGGRVLSPSRTIPLSIEATDATSAIDAVGVGITTPPVLLDDVTATPGLQRLQRQITVAADGEATIAVVVEDRAGNRSAVVEVPVRVDTAAPAIALRLVDAADGFARTRLVDVEVTSSIAGDDDLLVAVGLEGTVDSGGAAVLGPLGRRTIAVPADLAHGASLTIEALAVDAVGNSTRVTQTAILDLRGSISGSVVADSVPAIVPALSGATATLLDARGVAVGSPVVVGADGSFEFTGVAEGRGYAVRVDLAGHASTTVRNIAVIVDDVVDLGDVGVALLRGEVRGRALRAEQRDDGAAHAGITVALRLVSSTGRVFTDTAITDASGAYAFRNAPRTLVGEQLTLTATDDDHGSASASVALDGGLVIVADLLLPRARGDFDVCRTADAACAATTFFNGATIDIKLRDASDVVALHVGLDGGATQRLPLGAGNRTTVGIAAAGEGDVVVAVQAEKSDGSRAEVLSTTIVKDTRPPVGASVERRAHPLARDPRFTNAAFVDVVVAADAGTGAVSPLGAARVVVADTAPASAPTAGFVACAHDVVCRVALPAQEKLHRIFAFSCDAAGNCAAAATTFAIRDTTAPTTTNGAGFRVAAAGSVVEGGVTVLPTPLYDGLIDTGTARTAGGVAVVDERGAAVAEVFGHRLSLSAANLANVTLQTFLDAPVPAETRSGVDVVVPALPAGEAERTVFAQLVDAAGNVSAETIAARVLVDVSAPVVVVVINAGAPTALLSVPFSATVPAGAEAPRRLSFVVDDGAVQSFSLPLTGAERLALPNVEGSRRVVVTAIDRVGNASRSEQSVVLDKTGPRIDSARCTSTSCTDAGFGELVTRAADGRIELALTATDLLTGVASVEVTSVPAVPGGAQTVAFIGGALAGVQVALNTTSTLTLVAVDGVGNRGAPFVRSVRHDVTAPTIASFTIENGAARTNTAQVTVQIAVPANDAVELRLSATNTFVGAFSPFRSDEVFTFAGADGDRQVCVQVRDAAGNASSTCDTIAFDRTPPTGSISVAAGVTAAASVTATLTYPADTAAVAVSTTALSCDAASTTYVTATGSPQTTTIAVPGADGERALFACFKDQAGNTAQATTTVNLDRTPPAGAVVVNGNDPFARATTVAVTIVGASDVVRIALVEAASAPSCASATFVAFTSPQAFVVSAGDGTKTVQACLEDAAGNRAPAVADTIVLDRTAPAGTIVVDNGASATTTRNVVAQLAFAGHTDVAAIAVAEGSIDCASAAYTSVTTVVPVVLSAPEGTKTVLLCVKDQAGNVSAPANDTIVLDTTPPSLPATPVVIQDVGGFLTNVATGVDVRLSWTTIADVVAFKVGEGSVDCGSEPYTRPANIATLNTIVVRQAIAAVDGVSRVVACFKDQAGNINSAQDTTIVDTAAPTGAIVVANAAARTRLTTNVPVTISSIDSDLSAMAVIDATGGSPQTCANATYVPFSTTSTLTAFASTTNGPKTVGLCLRDRAGNQSTSPVGTDTIELDTTVVATGVTVALRGTKKDGIVDGDLTRTPAVTLVVTGVAADVVGIEIANDNGFFGAVSDIFGNGVTYAFQLDAGDGVKDIFVRLTDDAGNTVVLGNNVPAGTDLLITLDTTPPSAPVVSVGNGAAFATTTTTALTVSAQTVGPQDGAIEARISSNDFDFNDAGEAFSATLPTSVGLPAGNGTKTVIAQFRDQAGNETGVVSDTIDLDTSAPVAVADVPCAASNEAPGTQKVVCINSAARFANSLVVNVAVTASLVTGSPFTNATEMQVATDGVADAEPFIPYTTALTAVLPAGDGPKTVAVRFRDAAGNLSTGSLVDTIVLDSTPPNAPRIATASQVIDAATIVVNLSVDSADANFDSYQIRNGADFVAVSPNAPTCIGDGSLCAFTVNLTANTDNRISIRAIDLAGNVSVDDLISVREDSDDPVPPTALAVRGGDGELELRWTASVSTDVAGYRVYYRIDDNLGGCGGALQSFDGTSAEQGASPIDVGLNTAFKLTGISNGVAMCVQVTSYDKTQVPSPHESVGAFGGSTTPSIITLARIATLSPSQLGIFAGIGGTVVRDGLLYVAARNSPLVELDVANESCLTIADPTVFAACTGRVASAATLTAPGQILLHGPFAYVIDNNTSIKIFRVSSGTPPVLVQTLTTSFSGAALSGVRSIALERNLLVAGHDNRVTVWDISPLSAATPGLPTARSDIVRTTQILGIDLQAQQAILSDASAFDLANPAAPAPAVGCSGFGGNTTLSTVAAGSYVYAGNTGSGLVVCDRSTVVGGVGLNVGTVPFANNADRLVVIGPYVVGIGQSRLVAVDASNRSDIAPAATLDLPFSGDFNNPGNLSSDGRRLFVSSRQSTSLLVVGMGEPRAFERVGSDSAVVYGRTMHGADDHVLFGNELSVHMGRTDGEIEETLGSPGGKATGTVEEDNVWVLMQVNAANNFGVLRREVGGMSTAQTVATGLFTPGGSVLRWPFLVLAGNVNNASAALRVYDLRTNTQVGTELNLGAGTFDNSPGRLTIYGDTLYVASRTQNPSLIGTYKRVAFDPLTGALGAQQDLLTNLGIQGAAAWGRSIVAWSDVNATGLRITRLPTPIWDNANTTTINGVFAASRFSRPAMSGRLWVMPGNSDGFRFLDVTTATSGAFVPTVRQVLQAPTGAAGAVIAADRIYLGRFGDAVDIFSFR